MAHIAGLACSARILQRMNFLLTSHGAILRWGRWVRMLIYQAPACSTDLLTFFTAVQRMGQLKNQPHAIPAVEAKYGSMLEQASAGFSGASMSCTYAVERRFSRILL